MRPRGEELIANTLRTEGVPARVEDGWVCISLKDGRTLEISADNGASLVGTVYTWKIIQPAEEEPA